MTRNLSSLGVPGIFYDHGVDNDTPPRKNDRVFDADIDHGC